MVEGLDFIIFTGIIMKQGKKREMKSEETSDT